MADESSSSAGGGGAVAATTASSTTTTTTEELFRIWQTHCLQIVGGGDSNRSSGSSSGNKKSVRPRVAALQTEAAAFFAQLARGTVVQIAPHGNSSSSSSSSSSSTTTTLRTRPSHAEALAVLIRSLEPCFVQDASTASRWAALSCIVGALQGCRGANGGLSNNAATAQLLSAFLLPHAGPIESSGGAVFTEEDYGEATRDTAVTGLTALVQCLVDTTTEASTSTTTTEQSKNLGDEGIQLLVQIAKEGVERRCAEADHDGGGGGIANSNYDMDDNHNRHCSGLSLLPRSRRSLCFDLLRAAVDALQASKQEQQQQSLSALSPRTLRELTEFCQFTVSCLHGESDPRCLLQLLRLLGALTDAMDGFLLSSSAQPQRFPVADLFDAIAPYYPIQFNPPPNDTHGITRADLRCALLRLLSCTRFDAIDNNVVDPDHSMAVLAAGVILESLVPPPEDGPATIPEQMEALQDLQTFLMTASSSSHDNNHRKMVRNCDMLDASEYAKISNALLAVHEQAARAVARNNAADDADADAHRELADQCRSVVSQVAVALEQQRAGKNSVAAWKALVEQPVRLLSARLGDHYDDDDDDDESARVAIAYLAGLAASGGSQTLHICLERGLRQLLNLLRQNSSGGADDELRSTTAVYGIGAFASSCRVALEKAAQDGIRMHPHPLQPYSADAVDTIGNILLTAEDDNKNRNHEVMNGGYSLEIAAMRALESLLLVVPPLSDDESRSTKLCKLFRSMASSLVITNQISSDNKEAAARKQEFLASSSHALGRILGKMMSVVGGVLDESPPLDPSLLIESEPIRSALLDDILHTLVASTKIRSKTNPTAVRNDRQALALACTSSLQSAQRVVQPLVQALHQAILDGQEDAVIATSETLACLFDQSHQLAARAFQELAGPTPTIFDILFALTGDSPESGNRMEAEFGMSNLKLPHPTDYGAIKIKINKTIAIVDHLRKGYEAGVTKDHQAELLKTVDNVLPPLSDSDVLKLSFMLPILSAALENSSPAEDDESMVTTIDGESPVASPAAMAADLTEFAMDGQNDSRARTHAARCLHASISRFASRDTNECPAKKLAVDKVWPALKAQINAAMEKEVSDGVVEAFSDGLSLLSLLGSAAARRGGPQSSKTSDEIVLFLVNLACTKKADFPFDAMDGAIDLSVFDTGDVQESTVLSTSCASEFGSIISTDFGNVLWKQRLTHISVRRILECIASTTMAGGGVSLGALAAVCHVVCSSSLQHIAPKNHQAIADVVVSGLGPSSLQAAMSTDIESVNLLLAALVKLLCVSPALFHNSIYAVVTGTMRAYAIAADDGSDAETAGKLLALQALASAAQMSSTPKTLHALQPAVVSILGSAMNHPSGLLRHAAVEVKNTWALIE